MAFWASYNQGAGQGIYSNVNGVLETVANMATIVPGSGQPMSTFTQWASYDAPAPTFVAGNLARGGVYSRVGGQLVTIVDSQTPLPGGGGLFTGLGTASRSGERVVFEALGPNGLFLSSSNVITKITDSQTAAPGGGLFGNFDRPMVSGTTVAFAADAGTRRGLFLAEVSGVPAISMVADSNTPIPNGQGNFRALGLVSNSQGNIAFVGVDDQLRNGIYARINGQLLNIADTLHPGPGGIQFTNFGDVSISGENIAFTAFTSAAPFGGLYVLRGGQLSRVVARGDNLNGLIVSEFYIGPESLKGDTVAFAFNEVVLGPGTLKGGVYSATYIPAPGALGLGAAAALAAARRHRVHP